jgi:hypothetical protein
MWPPGLSGHIGLPLVGHIDLAVGQCGLPLGQCSLPTVGQCGLQDLAATLAEILVGHIGLR